MDFLATRLRNRALDREPRRAGGRALFEFVREPVPDLPAVLVVSPSELPEPRPAAPARTPRFRESPARQARSVVVMPGSTSSTPERPCTTTVWFCRSSPRWTRTPSATRISTRHLPTRARAQLDEQLVQLVERLGIPARRPGRDRLVQGLLRRIPVMDDEPGPALVLLEGRGRDDRAAVAFLVGPDEAGGRGHLEVPAEERHRLGGAGVEGEPVAAPDPGIDLARQQLRAVRLRDPPLSEQLGIGPCLEHDVPRAIDRPGHDQLLLGRPLDRRAIRRGGVLSCASGVHRAAPSVVVARRPAPTRRTVHPRPGAAPRSTPSRPRGGAGRAGRSAPARPSRSWRGRPAPAPRRA